MSLREKILNDLVLALKSKDEITVAVLKLLKNSIQSKEKELSKELSDDELNKILLSDLKKRKDSIEQFKKGGREDLVKKENEELEVIQKYLPKMKSKDEIKDIVCDIIKEESIEKSLDNFGQVMKLTMQRLNGSVEGNLVAEVVKEQLV